jgi:hypothetical protein
MDFLINTIDTRNAIVQYIYRLPIETRPYKAKIAPVKVSRSHDQNRYQWFVFDLIAKELGTTKELVHEFFSTLFLQIEDQIGDYRFTRTKGTSSLSTIEHNELMESVRIWCAIEEGIIIPLPGEVILDDLKF